MGDRHFFKFPLCTNSLHSFFCTQLRFLGLSQLTETLRHRLGAFVKRNLWLFMLLAMLMSSCGGDNWGWYVVDPRTENGWLNLKFLLGGMWHTIALSVCAIAISVVIGVLVALPGISDNRWARLFNRVYVEVVRSVPILVLILWVYYGLPVVFDLTLGTFAAGVIALALSDSAFEAEIFRAGIQSVEKGQHEAAKSLGLGYLQTMWLIVFPQALRRILPALGNQLVYMLKMSSLVSVIGLSELTRRANELVVSEYRPLEIYTVLMIEYLLLILLVSWAVRRLESRMANHDYSDKEAGDNG